MNGFKRFLYYFLYPACLIFTVLSISFYIISAKTALDEASKNYAILMILIFIYGCIISLFNQILFTKLNLILKTIIHYVLIASTIFIFFLLERDFFSNSSVIIVMLSFSIVYLLIAIPVIIFKYRKKSKLIEQKEYKKIK